MRPELGGYPLNRLTTAGLREWRATLLQQGVAQTIVAKSYRLLRAVLATAVEDDRLLVRNPCRIRGADRETPEERPDLTVTQVFQLATACRARSSAHSSSSPPCVPFGGARSLVFDGAMRMRTVAVFTLRHS